MKSFTIPSIYTAVDKFTGPVRKMIGTSQQFVSSLEAGAARGERWFRKLTPAISETTKQVLSYAKAASIAAAIFTLGNFSFNQIKEFDDRLASLRSITGKTEKQFEPFRKTVLQVAKDAKTSSVDTVEAFEKIAALNATFLESEKAIGQVSKATIILSKASKDELGTSAENLVGIMNQFSKQASEAESVVNILAAGAGVGASSITQSAEAYKNFGSVAKSANITLEQSQGLIQTVGKYNIFAAEAGTKLRGAVLQLQKAGVGYASGQFQINDALADAKAKIDRLKTAKQKDAAVLKMFGAENITVGKILLSNIDLFKQFTTSVTGTNAGFEQAEINSNTLRNRLSEVSAAWVNVITGSDQTNSSLSATKNILRFVADNMGTIVSVGLKVIGVFVLWKAILIATRAVIIAYNFVTGIQVALAYKSIFALRGNAVAMATYRVAATIATAAQWAWNAAMAANPIGLIVIGVLALIGVVTLVIKKWNEWGAAASLLMGPLGMIISLVMSFRRNWDMISDAFSNGGFIAGIKAIGKVILDAILMPLQQVMKLISNFTGAKWAGDAVKNIDAFRKGLGVETDEPLNPRQTEQNALVQRIEKTNSQNVKINIADETGRASVETDGKMVPIRLSTTWGSV